MRGWFRTSPGLPWFSPEDLFVLIQISEFHRQRSKKKMKKHRSITHVLSQIMALALILLMRPSAALAATSQFDIPGPANSGEFGVTVTVLPIF
jgi:hypothetical protein